MRKISLNGLFCPKSLVFKQILRTMKITLFLLLFVTFQAYSHATYSQSTRISIPRSELRVGEILDKIEAQTEYLFVYNKKSVDVRRTVNVDADNQPVSEVLDEIFNGTDIRYVMEGKNIVLTKQNEKASEIIATVQQENISVKGVVTDTKGEPIIGANVVEKRNYNTVAHYISDVGTIKDFVQNFGHRLIVCIYIYGAAHVHTFLIVDKQILGLSLDFIEDFAYS